MTETPSSYEPTIPETPMFTTGMIRADVHRAAMHLDPSERVQFWSTFQPTVEIPYPSVATHREVDDVAAVLAGSKPATILSSDSFNDPMVNEIVAKERDRFVTLSKDQAVDYYGGSKIFWGKEENVRALAGLYQGRGGDGSPLPADESFHRAVGGALGYPNDAVDDFVVRISESNVHQKQTGRLSKALSRLVIKR